MASQRGLVGPIVRNHAPSERNGELVDDLVDGQSGGDIPTKGKRRPRAKLPTEKGKGRNIKIPDALFDQLCLYARRTKVRLVGVDKAGREKEWVRSLTVSEAVCKFLTAGLPKLRIVEDTPQDASGAA